MWRRKRLLPNVMHTPYTYWEKLKLQSRQPVSDKDPKPGARKQARVPSVRLRTSVKKKKWPSAVSIKQQWHKYIKCLFTSFLRYLLTYLLIPWCRVLLQKLTGSHQNKKFPAFYGTRRIITAFTSARHLSLPWARSIQSMPPHPTS